MINKNKKLKFFGIMFLSVLFSLSLSFCSKDKKSEPGVKTEKKVVKQKVSKMDQGILKGTLCKDCHPELEKKKEDKKAFSIQPSAFSNS